ncbi:DUF6632 domain-containing protein [Labrys sp. KNU-23]|uniref:DUF6632 domain-containing protein n=1 Tax=Labrys sp. KNU-23 TaxID=2789216 RepID=UPI001AED7287|nr:DUF6632 domain-containing protein [Labrys sp. KNU-23]
MGDGISLDMSAATGLSYLRMSLILFGTIMIFGVYPLYIMWPTGWGWGHGQSHYIFMIVGIYATLGVFLLLASRNPSEHRSLIWFTIWSSAVHAAIMTYQAIADPSERGHLIGDVPALYLIAVVLSVLMHRHEATRGIG